MGSSRVPAWLPPSPKDDNLLPGYPTEVKPSRVLLERGGGMILVNGKWYREIVEDDRPVERRITAIGFAVIGVVCVAILTGTFLYFVIFGLLNLHGTR
jgi:hypothetical protein